MAIKSIDKMVAEARAAVQEVSPAEALRRQADEGALLVDIRDVRELQDQGLAAGAKHSPRGMLEFWFAPDSPYVQEVFTQDREFILYCSLGWRSSLATKALQDMGVERLSHIETGFTGWKADGLPITDYDTYKQSRR